MIYLFIYLIIHSVIFYFNLTIIFCCVFIYYLFIHLVIFDFNLTIIFCYVFIYYIFIYLCIYLLFIFGQSNPALYSYSSIVC
jgi:hypothetical protein